MGWRTSPRRRCAARLCCSIAALFIAALIAFHRSNGAVDAPVDRAPPIDETEDGVLNNQDDAHDATRMGARDDAVAASRSDRARPRVVDDTWQSDTDTSAALAKEEDARGTGTRRFRTPSRSASNLAWRKKQRQRENEERPWKPSIVHARNVRVMEQRAKREKALEKAAGKLAARRATEERASEMRRVSIEYEMTMYDPSEHETKGEGAAVARKMGVSAEEAWRRYVRSARGTLNTTFAAHATHSSFAVRPAARGAEEDENEGELRLQKWHVAESAEAAKKHQAKERSYNERLWRNAGQLGTTYQIRNAVIATLVGKAKARRVFEFAGNGGFAMAAAYSSRAARKNLERWVHSDFAEEPLKYAAYMVEHDLALMDPTVDVDARINASGGLEALRSSAKRSIPENKEEGFPEVSLEVRNVDFAEQVKKEMRRANRARRFDARNGSSAEAAEEENADGDDDLAFADFDTFVTISFEHFANDLGIIRALPAGANFIFCVPNFDHDTHFNIFSDVDEIRARYEALLEIRMVERLEFFSSYNGALRPQKERDFDRVKTKFVVWGKVRDIPKPTIGGPGDVTCPAHRGVRAGNKCVCKTGYYGATCDSTKGKYPYLTRTKGSPLGADDEFDAIETRTATLGYVRSHRCTHLLEFDGGDSPFTAVTPIDFETTEWLRITNVDPMSVPGILAPKGSYDIGEAGAGHVTVIDGPGSNYDGWIRRNLSYAYPEYEFDGDEDCFSFSNFSCLATPVGKEQSTFEFLKRMKMVALEGPISDPRRLTPTYDKGGGSGASFLLHKKRRLRDTCFFALRAKLVEKWGYTLIYERLWHEGNRGVWVYSAGGKPRRAMGANGDEKTQILAMRSQKFVWQNKHELKTRRLYTAVENLEHRAGGSDRSAAVENAEAAFVSLAAKGWT